MKPVNTDYRGTRFRIKLEAQWKVFLDAVGVEARYEPMAYDLGGQTYIPTFWCPILKCHLVVCESTPSEEARIKAGRMHAHCQRPTYLLVGAPEVPSANAGQETRNHILVTCEGKSINHQWWLECPVCRHIGIGRWVRGGWTCPCKTDASGDYKSPLLLVAYSRARLFKFDALSEEAEPPAKPIPGTGQIHIMDLRNHNPEARHMPEPGLQSAVAATLAPPIESVMPFNGLKFPAPPVPPPAPVVPAPRMVPAPIPAPVAPGPSMTVVKFDARRDIRPIREKQAGRVSNQDYVALTKAVEARAGDLQRALDNDGLTIAAAAELYHVPLTTLQTVFTDAGIREHIHHPELPGMGHVVTPDMMRDCMLVVHRMAGELGVPAPELERHLRTLRPTTGT